MLEIVDVSKSFDGQRVLANVSLSVADGEVMALLGPSGSGKTTLLRIIAGLEKADEGVVRLDGRDLTEVPVHERGYGMVFQDYALFPHKNVTENVGFGLRMKGWSSQRIKARVGDLLALVGLQGFDTRAVYELSGGEQQRVALARALAPEPFLLLLDEPLGALDHALRERLLGELRTILNKADALSEHDQGLTALYVTHDQAEAFAVADRVAILRAGHLEQVDTPVDMYRRPRTSFVARFLGMENLFEGHLVTKQPPTYSCALGEMILAASNTPADAAEQDSLLLVRPDAGRIVQGEETAKNRVNARLGAVSFRGRYQEVVFNIDDGGALSLEFDPGVSLPEPGAEVVIALDSNGLILIEPGR